MIASTQSTTAPRKVPRQYVAMLVLGGLALAVGGALAPARLWANLLLMTFLWVGMGLGGLLFLAFHHLTAARWSEPIRPIAEALGRTLPYTSIGLGLVVLAGMGNYPWMHEDLAAHRPTFWFKAAWLEPSFFMIRTIAYLLIWAAMAALMAGGRQRRSADASTNGGVGRWAAFVVVFALTFWSATTDWIMSLEPEWYSTIFAVYHFAGALAGAMAAITLLAVARHRRGTLPIVATAQLHDLGKLLFGFSSFWMYIWFSQYMLIWYTNIPEEAVYYVERTRGTWGPLFYLNLFLNWAIPFFVLLPRAAKRSPDVLIKVAVVMLAGRWLDLYLSVAPPLAEAPAFGFSEFGAVAVAIAVAGVLLRRTLHARTARRSEVPTHPSSAASPTFEGPISARLPREEPWEAAHL